MAGRTLLFLDVDGPLIPFGATSQPYPTYESHLPTGSNPLLSRINPAYGARLAALGCELIWATSWMADANDTICPLLGLPDLPVVIWPGPSATDKQDERAGLHWKTRPLVDWAAGRPFIWLDDELTATDRTWVATHHPGEALLHPVDPRHGLTDPDFLALHNWLS
ncbi:HAD domain-containing protein [Kribbella sp. NPDC006257]|uniref:HAD domain-containing protein n=1 Tax=Kribbella sp. NPDC006257 TaxID=3156738 RepID=UPI0033BF8244